MTPRPDPGVAMTALTSASASSPSLASSPSPSPGAPYTEPLPRSYLLSSWLGVAWGVAHVALKAPTLHEGSIGLPLTLAWVVALVAARRGRRTPRAPRTLQTLPVAAALGIVGCYWLAAMHVGIEVPGTFYYWDQVAGAPRLLWNMAYAALMCVGIVLGLANVWTVRAALRRARIAPVRFGAAVGLLLLAAGALSLALDARAGTVDSPDRWLEVVAFALIPAALLALPIRGRRA